MSDNRKRADQLVSEANRKLLPASGFLGRLLGRGTQMEEAVDLYVKAACLLKMDREWTEAGKLFSKSGDLLIDLSNKHEAASKYTDAAHCYKKCNVQEAMNCLLKAINIYTDMGRFSVAAKHHLIAAEIYEAEGADIPKAVEHYTKAADYYQCEESTATANRCLLNVARYAAQLEQYQRAIDIYESIGQSSLDNHVMKYGAKEHFLRAGLCHLCVDTTNAQIALKKYEEMCPSFADSREGKLLKQLCTKIEANDLEGFTEVITDYDSISKFDSWYTTLLTRIKEKLAPEDDLR